MILIILNPCFGKAQVVKGSSSLRPYFIDDDKFIHDSTGFRGEGKLDTTFYSDKSIKSIGFRPVDKSGFKTNYKVGLWTEFYKNGCVKSVGQYALQSVYGCCSGNACVQYYFYKTGEWSYYYSDKTLLAHGLYKLELKEINTGIAGQYGYFSVVTDNWALNESDGQPARNRDSIILLLKRSDF